MASLIDWLLPQRLYVVPALLLASLASSNHLRSDEGMYPISELGRLNLQNRGLELTPDQVFNPQQISLVDGICKVNGCTGSFVSDQGLIITNHHCAFDAIQQASLPDRDLLKLGFQARSRSEEIPAPNYTVRITQQYFDVSDSVLQVVDSEMSPLERSRVIERKRKELELQYEKEYPGWRAEVAEMFAGKTYVLFLYTFLRDVRLVFAPPLSVGNFGGEVDNWEWPRHTGDFAFMRAYTAPDGSSAPYAPENIAYRPKRVLTVAPQGVDEDEFVFILGYPGRTVRHRTASFLRYERDVRLPLLVEFNQWQIGVMEEAGRANREVAIKHSTRMKSLANVEKRSRGQLQGLRRARIVETKSEREVELLNFIHQDPARTEKYGNVLTEIESIYQEMAKQGEFEHYVRELRTACRLLSFAFTICDAVHERSKPDLDRETPYMDRNFALTKTQLLQDVKDWDPSTDRLMLCGVLKRLRDIAASQEWSELLPWLNCDSIENEAMHALFEGTRLGEPSTIEAWINMSPEELAETGDPAIRTMLSLYPKYLQLRMKDKEREGSLGRLYGMLIELEEQFSPATFVPDANSTLRITYGNVRGYSPGDAAWKSPISTVQGIVEKNSGMEPFDAPEILLEAIRQRDFGPFLHPRLNSVPVAILYSTDTTGGNSGSPVLNGRGELVGVNFDRTFEATINDFAWKESYSRSIGVDIRYVLWITGHVYGATHLLDEMGVPK